MRGDSFRFFEVGAPHVGAARVALTIDLSVVPERSGDRPRDRDTRHDGKRHPDEFDTPAERVRAEERQPARERDHDEQRHHSVRKAHVEHARRTQDHREHDPRFDALVRST
jgi:hypothetical protein